MIVGIDISKLKFDVTLLLEDGKEKHKVFSNNQEGFKKLETWLNSFEKKEAYGHDPTSNALPESHYPFASLNP